ncbi:MAG: type II toxin-antitoxin system VapC family toxin [Chloroflexota bacterium]
MTIGLLARHSRVGIDSNVLIYLLEGSGALADTSAALLDAIAAGEAEGVLATLGLAEICSGPARADDPAMVERYADELSSLENVRLMPLDREVAVEAAIIRGSTSLSIADAVHLASARSAKATVFVTNDRRITSINRLEVAYLDEI